MPQNREYNIGTAANANNRILYVPGEDWLIRLGQLGCSILIVYFCWYVEAFGNNGLIVYGSFFIATAAIGLRLLRNKVIDLRSVPVGIWKDLWVCGYCYCVGVFIAIDQNILDQYVRTYLIYFVVCFTISYISSEVHSMDWVLRMIIISSFICCIHMDRYGYHYSANRIVLSRNSNPNILGIILTLGTFSVSYLCKDTVKSFLVSSIANGYILLHIIQTGSRKSLLAGGIILVIWAINCFRRIYQQGTAQQKLAITGLLAVIGWVVVYYLQNSFSETEVFRRFSTFADEDSNSTRIELYRYALELYLDHPIFGVGFHMFGSHHGLISYSHSTYAEAISCLGTVGCVFYFFPIIGYLVKALKVTFIYSKSYRSQLLFALLCVELFLGVGQIWFYEMFHFIAWAIIFWGIDNEIIIITEERDVCLL